MADLYIRTQGQPIQAIQTGLRMFEKELPSSLTIMGVGATGSARQLTGGILEQMVKNDPAHAVAAMHCIPDVQTVIEIGGQDSKLIIIRDGVVVDFAMNTVCSAGTGSFLDHQADRLGIPIEEFGALALQSRQPVRIAGRCSVFAESDMIHKQQMGHSTPDIIAGLGRLVKELPEQCRLRQVDRFTHCLPRSVLRPIRALGTPLRRSWDADHCPRALCCDGCFGDRAAGQGSCGPRQKTSFRGFSASELEFATRSFECSGCPNHCEIVEIRQGKTVLARWGDRCHKWQDVTSTEAAS